MRILLLLKLCIPMPNIPGSVAYLDDSSNTSASQFPDHFNISFLIPYLSHFLPYSKPCCTKLYTTCMASTHPTLWLLHHFFERIRSSNPLILSHFIVHHLPHDLSAYLRNMVYDYTHPCPSTSTSFCLSPSIILSGQSSVNPILTNRWPLGEKKSTTLLPAPTLNK